jgi:hypothetical protein
MYKNCIKSNKLLPVEPWSESFGIKELCDLGSDTKIWNNTEKTTPIAQMM